MTTTAAILGLLTALVTGLVWWLKNRAAKQAQLDDPAAQQRARDAEADRAIAARADGVGDVNRLLHDGLDRHREHDGDSLQLPDPPPRPPSRQDSGSSGEGANLHRDQ